ncbi:MAG: PadR family transcriptional regulator [Candidatus Taylorbacteria bacterium]|nr:PadR family transcriptional regulator [Candidatus Taylorbacteria bacterium]
MQKITNELRISNEGILELIVLKMLSKRAYSIKEIFDELKMTGFRTPIGSLYPLFGKFRKSGLIISGREESEFGGSMKTFDLSTKGIERLRELRSDWKRLNHMIHS